MTLVGTRTRARREDVHARLPESSDAAAHSAVRMRGGGGGGGGRGRGVFGGRRLARDATHGAVAQGALDGRASALGVAPRAARLAHERAVRAEDARGGQRALANPP